MDSSLNIVALIENNPITRLADTYQNTLLTKIKSQFTNDEQEMFVASFYCFLNYPSNDFVIDLDNIWKWLDFQQKYHAKTLLEKNFKLDLDYKIIAPEVTGAKKGRGGHNKETIMLTIRAFKLFCLKAGTKKAELIHEYYIKLEEILQDVLQEESNELKAQLQQHTLQLRNNEKEIWKVREKTLLEQFPHNTQCLYYGIIDNLSDKNEKLIKFGNSNHLKNRVVKHRDTYLNFTLVNAFKVDNKCEIESAFKHHPFVIEKQRSIVLKNKKYLELLAMDGVSFSHIDKICKEIIQSIEYSPENYIKLLESNTLLKKQLEETKHINHDNELILLRGEIDKLKFENITLFKKIQHVTRLSKINETLPRLQYNNQILTVKKEEIHDYDSILHPVDKIYSKDKLGKYTIHGKVYQKLSGSRQEVWDETAYKTTGCLIKDDLLLNKYGKIVSKRKFIQETIRNRFGEFGVNKTQHEQHDTSI